MVNIKNIINKNINKKYGGKFVISGILSIKVCISSYVIGNLDK
jgi:hypothetical protein